VAKILYFTAILIVSLMTVAEALPYFHGSLPLGGSRITQIGYVSLGAVIFYQGATLWSECRAKYRKWRRRRQPKTFPQVKFD
jgi:hypothetical protein